MNQLLETIWGDTEGVRCVVFGKMRHTFFGDNNVTIPEGKDVWFAPSLFSTDERKAENVISSRAFYLDIDCKEGKYENINDAINALKGFVDQLNLPTPSAVLSGNGLHVYWILDRPVVPQQWHRVAKALHAACVELGLEADHAVTKDIARILRVPGTKNYKDPKNPKPVELLSDITTCTYEELETALDRYIFQAELAEDARATNKTYDIEYEDRPKDANRIADQCGQLRRFRDTKGNLLQPDWYNGIGILTKCVEGRKIAHEWSSGYAKYSERETDAKYDQQLDFGPTTCTKFASDNPEGCKGCPLQGKIKSPIVLGDTVTPIEDNTAEIINTALVTKSDSSPEKLPPPLVPKPYETGREGVYILVKTDEEIIDRQRILKFPLWVSCLMVGEDINGAEMELTWYTAEGVKRSAAFEQAITSSPQMLEATLRSRGINFFWEINAVRKYINACVMHVAETQKEEIVYAKFGYTRNRDGFVLGDRFIGRSETLPARISRSVDDERLRRVVGVGEREGWREASRLLDRPEFWPHRFAVLASFGTPLLALFGNAGSVLSLAGVTGSGKTTSANFGVSAFAHYEALTVEPKSTLNAFYIHLREAGNLPLVVNEAHRINGEYLSLIIHAVANGKARDASTKERKLIHSGGWTTLGIFTSNLHLTEFSSGILDEATKARVFELTFTEANKIPTEIGSQLDAAIQENYGVVGRLYLESVMRNFDDVKKLLHERRRDIEKNLDSAHRYKTWMIAAASLGGDIAKSLELIDFDTDDAISNAVNTLHTHAANTKSPIDRVVELIADYTGEFQRDIGTKEMSNATAWIDEPFGPAKGRYNYLKEKGGTYELCLPARIFNDYALSRGIDVNQIRRYMKSVGAKEQAVRVSRSSGAVHCYVMPYTTDES